MIHTGFDNIKSNKAGRRHTLASPRSAHQIATQ